MVAKWLQAVIFYADYRELRHPDSEQSNHNEVSGAPVTLVREFKEWQPATSCNLLPVDQPMHMEAVRGLPTSP